MSLIASHLVRLNDRQQQRDAETGVLCGAEARRLGPENGDKAVLFVHGFIATPNSFSDLPDYVAAQGWHVYAMLLPGHGTSPFEFQKTTAEELEQAVLTELRTLQQHYATVVLLGHSMGGALSTIVAAQAAPQGLILVAPYYSITKFLGLLKVEALSSLVSPILQWLPKPQSMQQVRRKSSCSKIIMYNWIPMEGVHTARKIAEKARQEAVISKITMPVMVIHSDHDRVTDPLVSRKLFEQLPAQEKVFHRLSQSNHVVFWDYDREVVKEQVGDFLKQWDSQ